MSDEILLHAVLVNGSESGPYEFVLNNSLIVTESVCVESVAENKVKHIFNAPITLQDMLFELNHVRVNPRVNNDDIINILTEALNNIGISVYNPPTNKDIASCFKPMGEISSSVRFFLNPSDGRVVFLSPHSKPKLVDVNKLKGK